jgi:hypothetical protein
MQEQFCLDHLTCVHDVELVPNANVLILRSAEEIDRFNAEWTEHGNAGEMFFSYIAWSTLRQKFDGLIVTPYIWDRRLAPNCMWYYGFDCASGCIWHPTAIRSITLRQS